MNSKRDSITRDIYETKYLTSRDTALDSLHKINELYISSL